MGANPPEPARGTWDGDALTLRVTTPKAEGRYTYRSTGMTAMTSASKTPSTAGRPS
jgi:hypothetical protein